MGLFGARKTPSKDHPSHPNDRNVVSPRGIGASGSRLKLAALFSDSREDKAKKSNSQSNDVVEEPAPTIDMDEFDTSKPAPADMVTPIAANQFGDDGRSFAALNRKATARPAQAASGLQEIAIQRAESLSRLAKRNSIKRSVSRKIARSESRRQLLNIKDDSLEDRGSPSLSRRATVRTTSVGADRREGQGSLARSHSSQALAKQGGRMSVSPVSSVAKGLLEDQVKGLGLDERRETGNDGSARDETLMLGEDEATLLGEHVDDDVELNHASLRDISIATGPLQSSKENKGTVDKTQNLSKSQSKRGGPNSKAGHGKQRKRPPPLLGGDDKKSAPDSATDWPSGGCFGSDGGFVTGGFKITADGMVGKPSGVTREDSDTQLDDAVPQSSRNLVIVQSLTEFRAGPTIGAGAAGRVYLAEHTPSRKTMALKVVNVYDKQKRNQLLKELETLSTHVSRYLVRFYGAFYDGSGAVHIALEYMDHGCLSTFVQRVGAIPEKIVQMIASDCLRGLRFLHRHHVLHRDFKTANILLSRRLCCAKLSDFGLARDLNAGVSKVDTFVGTVAYMSPERLQGSQYTYASDIWALGVSVVECLLGRYPFDRPQNYFDYIEATMTANMLSGFGHRGSPFSAAVRDFVKLCTFTDPKQRPPAAQLLEHPWLKDVKRDNDSFGMWLDECRIISMRPGGGRRR